MITTNVFSRIFHIKFGTNIGTCFTIDFEGKQYFVTAKHVIENLIDNDIVELFYQNKWQKIEVNLIGHSKVSDVSVFATNINFGNLLLNPTVEKITYGQDLYFLGFPFGLKSEVGELNREFPLPLVKKGIVSAIIFDQPGKYLLIDGHNNPGFSGGPVVFKPNGNNDFSVCAVISAYRYNVESTYLNDTPTQLQVKANTGIVIAYTIDNAIDLIKLNPNGKTIQ